jgi:hypothetical protein
MWLKNYYNIMVVFSIPLGSFKVSKLDLHPLYSPAIVSLTSGDLNTTELKIE